VKRCVRVYIEGGSSGGTADSDFRRGWKKFLNELHEAARNHGYHSLEVVRGKGRASTYDSFKNHHLTFPEDLCVLLVDSETMVPEGTRVWDVVGTREGDKWPRPTWATERHLYLMVNFVETWIVTDHDALRVYFKRGFDPRALPSTGMEARSKGEIQRAIEKATENTQKGRYRHGQAHEIIELVKPANVKMLRHGRRLFDTLGSLIRGEPEDL